MVSMLVLLLLSAPAVARVPDRPAPADPRWQALRERYLDLRTLSGSFEQTVRSEAEETARGFTGNFWSVLPDRYRLEVTGPERQLIIASDTALWFYFPDEGRAIREARPRAMPLLAFLDPVLDASTLPRLETGPGGTPVVLIEPDDEMAALQDLRLELSTDWRQIEAFEFSDPWGNEYRFVLRSQAWNPDLPDTLFRFRPPRGTAIE